ncbi:ABC transporter-like protein [Cordyceps fumosorosea ARSEF 2679]|uniref:ABC transporter-like protein n=1 Tax=Cordyceps fumosorosea (strain ARSEF 2679) TaxID=1081104 RepID=A0A167MZ01_CORFA|nr:ABC transporter-like protein [Cordyceps fumosorosea ARSEF 2679]OAA54928.1 ABC transporter-like protein [Cordyceps fumosorosea ARSEF 2679]
MLDEASITSGRLGRPSVGEAVQDGLVPGSTAYVAQPPWTDNCSIRDNIVFGFSFEQERYEGVLKACALNQDFEFLADGDATIAGAGGSSLSGGQKWRVALARALYSLGEIVILEDVLGAVDTPIASWICSHALTGDVAAGRTVILATHRPEFCIEAARYVVTVENGTAVGNS